MSLLDLKKKFFPETVPFMLTCAVTNLEKDSCTHSDKIRKVLSKLDDSITGWTKHDDIDTTYYGKLTIESNEWDDKKENNRKKEIKEHVKKIVSDAIQEELSENLDNDKAKISMMIMVNGVSEPFEISFDE